MRTLGRRELTAALAARQLLLERVRLPAAGAVARLTPLQGQHPPAPYLALAARLDGFARRDLEAAVHAGAVVKATLLRLTLHLVAAADQPAYAQLCRRCWMRRWRTQYPHLDEERVVAELGAWLSQPRTNAEIRERVRAYDGVTADPWTPVLFARSVLPLVQLPPAGSWDDPRRPRFVVAPQLPDPDDAATVVLARYLEAFGPASRRDVAAWSGVPQKDFAAAFERLGTVRFHDEHGTVLFDLPGRPLPPADVRLPVRLLAHWDQPLLAYADRERIMPAALAPLQLTQSGDPTVTVDGRVAASWAHARDGGRARVTITPYVELARAQRAAIREEAARTVRAVEPGLDAVEVAGV